MSPPATSPDPAPTSPSPETKKPDDKHIDVTVALAQAGYLFSMYHNEGLGVFWVLPFDLPTGQVINIEVQVHGTSVTIIGNPGLGIVNDDLCRAMLKLNGLVATARAGFNPNNEIIILSHFQRDAASPEQLRRHIQSVIDAAAEAQRIAGAMKEQQQAGRANLG
jgi:hypothetical protein